MNHNFIELDDGKILTGKPDQFDGKNPWVSGVDFPVKTNPVTIVSQFLVIAMNWFVYPGQICIIPNLAGIASHLLLAHIPI